MYKMIVSDFDGTLIDDYESVPISTVLEIDDLRKSGIIFTVATGRILKSILDYNRDFTFVDYVISCNGAYIYDLNREKVIYKKSLSLTIIKKLVKKYYDNGIFFCTPDNWNLLAGKNMDSTDGAVIDDLDSFYEENKKNIFKLEIYFKNKREWNKEYKDLVEMNLPVSINKQTYGEDNYLIEMTDKSVNKCNGLLKLCEKKNISLDEVVAFGDNYNDIDLIKNVGCGVCVSNAVADVKKASKKRTLSNNKKGVEVFLKKIFK